MTLTEGTNCGIVETAPTADPVGDGTRTIDGYARGVQIVVTESITVIEMGWWCDTISEEANFEVGIYDDNGDIPYNRLYVDNVNAKGTTAGWKVVSGLSWSLSPGTYWLCVQCDDVTTTTGIDYGSTGLYAYTSGMTELPDPWSGTSTSTSWLAIYGLKSTVSYKLEGVTKDKDGTPKANCECFLFKDNGDNTLTFVAHDQSDGSGNYSFTGLSDNDAAYLVYSFKDDTPHVFDVTDHVLQPVEE